MAATTLDRCVLLLRRSSKIVEGPVEGFVKLRVTDHLLLHFCTDPPGALRGPLRGAFQVQKPDTLGARRAPSVWRTSSIFWAPLSSTQWPPEGPRRVSASRRIVSWATGNPLVTRPFSTPSVQASTSGNEGFLFDALLALLEMTQASIAHAPVLPVHQLSNHRVVAHAIKRFLITF